MAGLGQLGDVPAMVGLGAAAAAALLAAGLIVLLRPVLVRYALARPNARSSHRVPTPQGGGIAVVAAVIAVSLAAAASMPDTGRLLAALAPVLTAGVGLAAVGAVDDIRPLSAGVRLVLQALAVGAVILMLPGDLRVASWLPWSLERALLILGGVWFVNLVNFMDGLDWITVAEIVPVAGGVALLGSIAGMPAEGLLVALALLGAMLGFAPFNRPVARLFLGDVGSLPIGLLTGWLLVLFAGRGHVAAAVLLPLYHVADATVTLVRRLARHERVWEAHRSHFYQRATDNGFTVPQVVARVFVLNIVLLALSTAAVLWPSPAVQAGAVLAGAVGVGVLLVRFAMPGPRDGRLPETR